MRSPKRAWLGGRSMDTVDASPILLELAVCRASAARHLSAVRNMLRSVYHRGAWTNTAVKRWTQLIPICRPNITWRQHHTMYNMRHAYLYRSFQRPWCWPYLLSGVCLVSPAPETTPRVQSEGGQNQRFLAGLECHGNAGHPRLTDMVPQDDRVHHKLRVAVRRWTSARPIPNPHDRIGLVINCHFRFFFLFG